MVKPSIKLQNVTVANGNNGVSGYHGSSPKTR
jgi:hypothetical protein